jgi:hypothetical protein
VIAAIRGLSTAYLQHPHTEDQEAKNWKIQVSLAVRHCGQGSKSHNVPSNYKPAHLIARLYFDGTRMQFRRFGTDKETIFSLTYYFRTMPSSPSIVMIHYNVLEYLHC